jgi:PTH1 family peptidyl-tRNA hydrolase
LVIDEIAKKQGIVMRLENQYKAQKGDFENSVMFVKPQTFMNNSGEATSLIKNYYKIDSEDIIIIHDDVDLEPGKIRVQLGGSSAGHKGVQSIIDQIGTDQFWRVRVGVGKSEQIPTDEWVLKNFEDKIILQNLIDKTAIFVLESLNKGMENTSLSIN